jgi:glycosyltransferase involved in cell wall biosynthesis
MTDIIKISIIVPVHNTSNYLRKCIESLINQTLKEIEIIFVNDGSTDNSLVILDEYAARDKRISVISQENYGPGSARNAGIKLAKGEYLRFVDSDDFVDLTMYEKLYKNAIFYNSDVVIVGIYLYDTNTGAIWTFRNSEIYKAFSNEGIFTAAEHPVLMQYVGIWDKLYKRELVEKYSLVVPENCLYEDVLFPIQAYVLADRISLIDEPLYYYRKFAGNSIVDRETKEDDHKFDFLRSIKDSRDFLISKNLYQHFQKDFLMYQFKQIGFHRCNLHGYKNYKRFMMLLNEYLDKTDFELAFSFDLGKSGIRYLKYLKKKKYLAAYLDMKFGHLFKIDNFWIQFRIPKTKIEIRLRRRNFYFYTELQRQEWIAQELAKLNNNLEMNNNKLAELLNMINENSRCVYE